MCNVTGEHKKLLNLLPSVKRIAELTVELSPNSTTAKSRDWTRPLQSVLKPSYLAIFFRPSIVDVNVRRFVSSATHSEAVPSTDGKIVDPFSARGEGPAMQNSALLLTQNTSRQHADTPKFGGSLANDEVALEACDERVEGGGAPWD